MNNHFMDRVLFAAVMTALSELEDFRKNENFGVSIDKEVSFVTCADDFDASNGRECLYKMLLNIVRDANAACTNDNGEGSDINSETEDLDSNVISGVICGILYQSISETDVDERQKISLLNCGLKYLGLDAELSGEMFFNTDQKLGDIMLNMLNVGLSTVLEGAVKAGNPSAGTQFIATLTELLAHTEVKIKEEYPSVFFKTKLGEIPINFAMEFYKNKLQEMESEEEMVGSNNIETPDVSTPISRNENLNTLNDKEASFITSADDYDASNGPKHLHKMLLNIVRDANAACSNGVGTDRDIQTETEDLDDSVISGLICGILFQSISEIDIDNRQKISMLNYGLKYSGLDTELSGEMLFSPDQMLADNMVTLSEKVLSMALTGAVKAGTPDAGTQFVASLTELLSCLEGKIREGFPSVSFKTRPAEIAINFAMTYANNKMHEMKPKKEVDESSNIKEPEISTPISHNEHFNNSSDWEGLSFSSVNDIEISNVQEHLHEMLLNTCRDLYVASGEEDNFQSMAETLNDSSIISAIFIGILYQSISESDINKVQKINIFRCGLKSLNRFGINTEPRTAENYFGEDQESVNNILNGAETELMMMLNNAFLAGNPDAGILFFSILTEVLVHIEVKIKEEYPSVCLTTKPWEIPINFAMDYYKNRVDGLHPVEKVVTPTWITEEYMSIDDVTTEIISNLIEENPDKYALDSEFILFKPKKYIYKDRLESNGKFFFLSAKNRFITSSDVYINCSHTLNFEPRENFSDRLFNVTCDPSSHSISVAEYVFYFDSPLIYNYALILMIDSDNRFKSGERIRDRIITYPLIHINDEILAKYDIHFNETDRKGLLLHNASYCVLNDYNEESTTKRAEGTFELRFINMKDYNPEDIVTYSIHDVLNKDEFESMGISIIHVPPYDELNDTHYSPFSFLFFADALTLRGSADTRELFVCRLQDGWGGIKFKLNTEKDFYKLSSWLLLATSAYLKRYKGWDREKCVKKYWPTYSDKNVNNIKIDSRNNWKLHFEKTLVWDNNINIFQQRSLQIWDDVTKPFSYNEENYACEISYLDINGEGYKTLCKNDEIICEYIKLENTEFVLLYSNIICALSEYQIALLDQLNNATDNFQFFKSDCSEEIQIKNLNGTCISSNNEDGDLEVSLDKLYIWDSSKHAFVECSMVLKYSVNSDEAYPVKINIMYGNESDGKASRVDAAQNIDIHFIEDIGITILNDIIMILSDSQKEFFQQKLNG